ncbi:hypothetical protein FA13DRAFT_1687269 [Coprinellus micaceus]|uniref:Alpha/beta-hydrolase n=1 Tax=Coprinellus micaceus TaxID=71717 RepID=A0A4Y7TED3_COPMI|nr:hypothetical protein FA13DRAFT_1687269 [Coprinellus micaceus]
MRPLLSLRALSITPIAVFHLPLALGAGGSCEPSKSTSIARSEAETWGTINPSKDLIWHSCYQETGIFECARLQVPLDYAEPGGRQAAIALIRKPATTREGYRGPVLFNPGGPGDSGVNMILSSADDLATILGPQFDIVSFDPRGIARSTPRANHFDMDVERVLFGTLSGPSPWIEDGVVTGIERVWAQSQLLGALAASHDDGYLEHITTENTASDMLRIVQAHGEEKLQYWGFSYGSILGATFAALYPDKVERMVLDGVADAEDYYATAWLNSLTDSEKTLQLFFDHCAEAGPANCPFYSLTPSDIQGNIIALQDKLIAEPIAVRTDTYYGIVDHSTLHFNLFISLYSPFASFKPLANALAQLAAGNGTALLSLLGEPVPYTCSCDEHAHDWDPLPEAFATVLCNDGAEVSGSLKDLQDYWNELAGVSQFADYWGTIHAGCVGWPKNKKPFHGPFVGDTSHPILLIGNTADPVTPLSSAKKMASGFKNSVVLTIDAGGHTSLGAPSVCAHQHVWQYFQNGSLPGQGTVCDPIIKNSFLVPASPEGNVMARGLGNGDEDAKLLAAVTRMVRKFKPTSIIPRISKRGL